MFVLPTSLLLPHHPSSFGGTVYLFQLFENENKLEAPVEVQGKRLD